MDRTDHWAEVAATIAANENSNPDFYADPDAPPPAATAHYFFPPQLTYEDMPRFLNGRMAANRSYPSDPIYTQHMTQDQIRRAYGLTQAPRSTSSNTRFE